MKKTDIAMVVFIASIGVMAAWIIASNLSFLQVPEQGVSVQTMRKISPDIEQPSKDVFNDKAINPTVEVYIGADTGEVNTQEGGVAN